MLQGSFFSLYQDYHKKCITVYHLSIFYIPPHFLARFGGSPSKIFIPRNILGLRNPQSLGARHSTFARGHAPGCGRACARAWAGVRLGMGGCAPGHGRVYAWAWAGVCLGMGGCMPGCGRVYTWRNTRGYARACRRRLVYRAMRGHVGGRIISRQREGIGGSWAPGRRWESGGSRRRWIGGGRARAGNGRASAATGHRAGGGRTSAAGQKESQRRHPAGRCSGFFAIAGGVRLST